MKKVFTEKDYDTIEDYAIVFPEDKQDEYRKTILIKMYDLSDALYEKYEYLFKDDPTLFYKVSGMTYEFIKKYHLENFVKSTILYNDNYGYSKNNALLYDKRFVEEFANVLSNLQIHNCIVRYAPQYYLINNIDIKNIDISNFEDYARTNFNKSIDISKTALDNFRKLIINIYKHNDRQESNIFYISPYIASYINDWDELSKLIGTELKESKNDKFRYGVLSNIITNADPSSKNLDKIIELFDKNSDMFKNGELLSAISTNNLFSKLANKLNTTEYIKFLDVAENKFPSIINYYFVLKKIMDSNESPNVKNEIIENHKKLKELLVF